MGDFGDVTEIDVGEPIKIGCFTNSKSRVLRLVHISDTHLQTPETPIPDGDVLVHSGGFFNFYKGVGSFLEEVSILEKFFASQPHKYKIFVAGNHEQSFVGQPIERIRARLGSVIYLQDNSVMIEGLTFHGSPWTGKRKSTAAAFVTPFPELGKYWVMIPKETDVLITHCPPHRVLDDNGIMGCPLLREIVVKEIRPMLHLFGHSHQGTRVIEKQGIFMSNGAQYGNESAHPLVFDIHLSPDLPNKTKLYKPSIWKEDTTDSSQDDTNENKKSFNCNLI
ncbi:hypothetical protein HELRODRAFT_168494 [Helobdella robusta]|uniref:Calcineurin-like phosphoesterase domain-containing protein n=1 Tax=Helobdella robusta TaxID=6412 RepID=T1F0M8_HELRO|nr:hypothetical protein HELRODRAFT_168494 [Helobdella robusta]ESO09501.1 hypothetical protein HELRODRAFT_168494 [Helobdella robusta]